VALASEVGLSADARGVSGAAQCRELLRHPCVRKDPSFSSLLSNLPIGRRVRKGDEAEARVVSGRVAWLNESLDFTDARERRELLRYVAEVKSLIALPADAQPFNQQR
jgi:hypothetical protein